MTPLRHYVSAALLGLVCALGAASARAQEGPDASLKSRSWLAAKSGAVKTRPVAVGPSIGLGRSLSVLVLAGVLGGSALYLRRRKNMAPNPRSTALRVLGATKLGGRAQLVLAEVAGRKILLGVTDASVRKLGWLEPDAEEQELHVPRPRLVGTGVDLTTRAASACADPVPAPKRSFRDALAAAVGNIGRPADSAADMLAAETQDTYTRSTPRAADARRAETAHKLANPQMVDVEGQARGLLARLGDPRA